MGKIVYQKYVRGSGKSELPQNRLYAILNDQRLQYVVADHLNQVHYISDFKEDREVSYTKLLKEAFNFDPILRSTFDDVFFLISNVGCVLTPVFSSTATEPSESPLLNWGENEQQLEDTILGSKAKNLYKVDQSLLSTMEVMFPQSKMIHKHSWGIQHYSQMCTNLPGHRIFVEVLDQTLEIYYFKDAELQFVNDFVFTNEKDFLYYIMLMYHQFDLNPDEDSLAIFGAVQQIRGHVDLLKDYVRNIQFLQYTTSFKDFDSTISADIRTHYYAILSFSSSNHY
ncbi:MAG: DUF3822 family protein [Bacteroidia bacterium]|nr:DUF3822 family protein [Bacteroidia bacterium]